MVSLGYGLTFKYVLKDCLQAADSREIKFNVFFKRNFQNNWWGSALIPFISFLKLHNVNFLPSSISLKVLIDFSDYLKNLLKFFFLLITNKKQEISPDLSFIANVSFKFKFLWKDGVESHPLISCMNSIWSFKVY